METPEQQIARYDFYKAVFTNGEVQLTFFLSLCAVLVFILLLMLILSSAGAFGGGT